MCGDTDAGEATEWDGTLIDDVDLSSRFAATDSARSRRRFARHESDVSSTTAAQLRPLAPHTPAPGNVAAPVRYSPAIAVS